MIVVEKEKEPTYCAECRKFGEGHIKVQIGIIHSPLCVPCYTKLKQAVDKGIVYN